MPLVPPMEYCICAVSRGSSVVCSLFVDRWDYWIYLGELRLMDILAKRNFSHVYKMLKLFAC